jgi:hypothetical protein
MPEPASVPAPDLEIVVIYAAIAVRNYGWSSSRDPDPCWGRASDPGTIVWLVSAREGEGTGPRHCSDTAGEIVDWA